MSSHLSLHNATAAPHPWYFSIHELLISLHFAIPGTQNNSLRLVDDARHALPKDLGEHNILREGFIGERRALPCIGSLLLLSSCHAADVSSLKTFLPAFTLFLRVPRSSRRRFPALLIHSLGLVNFHSHLALF